MPLAPGSRLGPYEVAAPLGAGGMGEVYRARDPRLGRAVAIKVISGDGAPDAERLRRFEQEARAVAALDHPHILAIHDIGTQDGTAYVVFELLEGETLRDRLRRGPLVPRKVVDLAVHICEGLAAAHSRGIVHRDLKPENLFLTRDGRIKILDFGLARLSETPSPDEEDAVPTRTATERGLILGTVGYMSPEQVRGRPADARSDLFAVGAILYEMLAGQRAFQGATKADTLSAILRHEPPDPDTPSGPVPTGLARVMRRCLEKDQDERFQSARDVAFALEAVSSGSGVSAPVVPSSRFRWGPAAAFALLAVAAPAAFWLGDKRGVVMGRAAAVPTLRQLTFRRGTVNNARFSPDGNTVLYDARWEGRPSEIFSIRLDSVESHSFGLRGLLAATTTGEMLVLLPTSADEILRIFSNDESRLARAPLQGGPLREISDNVGRADPAPGSADLAVVRVTGDRVRLEFPVGRVLYAPSPPAWINSLRVSPRGDLVAFVDLRDHTTEIGSLAVLDRSGTKTIVSEGWYDIGGLAWTPDGREIWFTAGRKGTRRALYAVTLGGKERTLLRLAGSLVLQDVASDGRVLLTHARRGWETAGLFPGDTQEHDYSWLDATQVAGLSPDGRTLAFQEGGDGGGPLLSGYLRQTDGSPAVRLGDGYPMTMSDDGRFVIAALEEPPPRRLALVPTGAGEARVLPRGTVDNYQWAFFAPGGQSIAFTGHEAGRPRRGFIQELPDGLPRPVTPEGTRVFAFAPDGRIVAAPSDLSSWALYSTAGGAPKPLPWLKPGEAPVRWGADAHSLYVRETATPARIARLDLRTGRREPWRELMPADRAGVLYVWMVQMTPDGRYYAYSYPRELSDLFLVDGLR